MKLVLFVSSVSLVLFGAALVLHAQSADDPLDAVKVCKDTQKVLIENAFVRVIDDQIPPGVTEPRHRHPHGVSIYLSDYTTEQISDDGKVTAQPRKRDTAGWNEPVIHQVRNGGTTMSHSIRIELKF